MTKPQKFVDLAASVAQSGSAVLIDTSANDQSYLLKMLEESGADGSVVVELPDHPDLSDVSVVMTRYDEEGGVVQLTPLKRQKTAEGQLVVAEMEEGDEDDVAPLPQAHKGAVLSAGRPSESIESVSAVPAKAFERKDKGLFYLMIGRGSTQMTTRLEQQVGLSWTLHSARNGSRVELSVDNFSINAAEGARYFVTEWNLDVLGKNGWVATSWEPMDRRAEARILGERSSHMSFNSTAKVSEAPFEAGVGVGRSTQFQIDRPQKLWWVSAGMTPSAGVPGVGWVWKTTAWSDMNKRTNVKKDTVTSRYVRGQVSVSSATIDLVTPEKPKAVFENTDKPYSTALFDINATAVYKCASIWPGRYKVRKMKKSFVIQVDVDDH